MVPLRLRSRFRELDGEPGWSVCYKGTLLPWRKVERMATPGFLRAVRAATAERVAILPSEGGAR